MRRNSAGRRTGARVRDARLSAASRFAALFQAGDVWFDASSFTSSGGNVTALVDRNSASNLLSVTSGTLAIPTADAALGGALAARFTGTQLLTSNQASSFWDFLYTTPSHVFTVQKPTSVTGVQVALEVLGAASANRYTAYLNDTALATDITRSATSQSLSLAAGVALNVPTLTEARFDVSVSPARYLKSTGVAATTAATIVGAALPSAGTTLTVGGRAGGTLLLNSSVRAIWIFKRILTASEVSALQAYVLSTTGVAA